MESLRRFYNDAGTREDLKTFLTDFIASEGVRLIFERKDVSHIADAKMLIDQAFEELNTLYGIQEQAPIEENPSR